MIIHSHKEKLNEIGKQLAKVAADYHNSTAEDSIALALNRVNAHKFYVTVAGEFSNGKTTLVNALLGANELPVSAGANSSRILEIHYGKEKKLNVIASNQKTPTEIDKLSELVTDFSREKFDLEFFYPCEFCQDGVVIVDTPGLQDIMKRRVEVTYKYIPKTDALIFVVDASSEIRESEYRFLEEMLTKSMLSKLIIVVNKIDILPGEDECEAFLKNIERRMKELFHEEVHVCGLSSLNALKGILKGDDRLISKSRWIKFKTYLLNFLENDRYDAMVKTGASCLKIQCASLKNYLSTMKQAIGWDESSYRQKADEIGKKIKVSDELLIKEEATFAEKLEYERQRFSSGFKTWILDNFLYQFIEKLKKLDRNDLSSENVKVLLESHISEKLETTAQEFAKAIKKISQNYGETILSHLTDTQKGIVEIVLSHTDIKGSFIAKIPPIVIVGVITFIAYQCLGIIEIIIGILGAGKLGNVIKLPKVFEFIEHGQRDIALKKIRESLKDNLPKIAEKFDEELNTVCQNIRKEISERIAESGEASVSSLSKAIDDMEKERQTANLNVNVKCEKIEKDIQTLVLCDKQLDELLLHEA